MKVYRKVQTAALSMGLLGLLLVSSAQASNGEGATHRAIPLTKQQLEFRQNMRKLWEDHITWTRDFIIADLANAPDQNAAATRLLKNQEDIGAAFAVYYGPAKGNMLTALLKTHITTAVDVIAAAKANDPVALQAANDAWYENGEEIVAFLHTLNPKQWSEADLDEMMDAHLDLTENEVVVRLNGDYAADVQAYDAVHDEALMMSDMLSVGIIQQFPKQFKGSHKAGHDD